MPNTHGSISGETTGARHTVWMNKSIHYSSNSPKINSIMRQEPSSLSLIVTSHYSLHHSGHLLVQTSFMMPLWDNHKHCNRRSAATWLWNCDEQFSGGAAARQTPQTLSGKSIWTHRGWTGKWLFTSDLPLSPPLPLVSSLTAAFCVTDITSLFARSADRFGASVIFWSRDQRKTWRWNLSPRDITQYSSLCISVYG